MRDGKVVGVIELYEANKELAAQIARNTRFSWARSSEAGVALYTLLFLVFARAYRNQKNTSAQLVETQDVTIFALAYQAELRDKNTGQHLERTSTHVRLPAEELSRLPACRSYLTSNYIEELVKSAPLRDIGKVGMPDCILLKPGPLRPQEMTTMKKQCEYGAQILLRAEKTLKFQSFLTLARQLTLHHHENWDGSGYPLGLPGDRIPLSARIMTLADVYDALRSARAYKPPLSHVHSMSIIRSLSGTQLDPQLVDALIAREEEFRRVSEQLAD